MTGGMALGVVPGLAYKEQSLKLEAGDSLSSIRMESVRR